MNKKKLEELKMLVIYTGDAMRIAAACAIESAKSHITPGIEGKAKRNEIKLFRTAIKYKFIPLGNKNLQKRKLDILDKKDKRYCKIDAIDNGYIRELSREEQKALRDKCLKEIHTLDKKEKQLKKIKRR